MSCHIRVRQRLMLAVWKVAAFFLVCLLTATLLSACAGEPQATPTPLARASPPPGTPEPRPTPTATYTPAPTEIPAPTATATHTAVPAATHTPTPVPTETPADTPTPQPTATATHTAVPTDTPTPTPRPIVKLVLGAEADLVGYWSDGTVGIEIAATLHNQGNLARNDAVSLSVTCRLADRTIDECSQQASVSLPDGFGPVTETFVIRSPAGKLAFDIDYGEENAHTLLIDAPSRIVGVHRDVWECFKDQSNRGTGRDEDEGIGCGAWSEHIVQKWHQGSPVKVWINGPRAFTAEFEDVLAELSPVVNLQFERVTSRGDADVSAWVGLTVPQFRGTGAECYNVESMGCAHIESEWSGRVRGGEIIVFNLWPDKGKDLGDFGDWRSSLFRSAMLHEAVHLFGRMDHRTEPFSTMNRVVHERAELTPMDEALLRLHGHEMVKAGMAMDDIERQIVLNDELLDPQPQSSRLRAHTLVLKAYGALREATSARFRVRSSTQGCDEDSGWAEYQVGNPANVHPYFEWVRLDDGQNKFYVLRQSAAEFEYWSRSGSRWVKTDSDSVASTLNGWRGELSDPHYMLTMVLNYADWSAVEVSVDSDGNAMLSVNLDLSNADDAPAAEGVGVVMVIDEGSHVVREYVMDWNLGGGSCDDHRVKATEGQLRDGFSFPEAIRLGSAFIDNCNAEPLGSVSESSPSPESGLGNVNRRTPPSTDTHTHVGIALHCPNGLMSE